jgi:hypothetical protein
LTFSANTLFITVVIAVVIGILCSLMIMLGYQDRHFDQLINTQNRLERDLQSGINLVLADTSLILAREEDKLDLFSEGNDTVTIRKENWGLFSLASVEVTGAGKKRSCSFFFGQAPDTAWDGCIYLAEHKTPLSLVGDTRLSGDAWLPGGGLRPGFIGQRGFSFSEMIKGDIRNSADSLPLVDRRLAALFAQLREQKGSPGMNGNGQMAIPDSLNRSFADSLYLIYRKGPIWLSSCDLKGHIMVMSDSMIGVSGDAHLENVILAAPVVELDSGFSGNLQAMASDSIIVKRDCHLAYPSSLVLWKTGGSGQPKIRIAEDCTIEGVILTDAPGKNDMFKTYVESGRNTLITGLIYAAGYLFLKGAVHGTVLTDYFLYRSSSTVFENYLTDAEIDRNARSRYFILPHVFNHAKANRIVKWLN